MKIFVSHSSSINYQVDLYKPIKNYFCDNNKLEFIFPEDNKQNTKQCIKNCDVFLCEISTPSFGVGIEAGWADLYNKPIYCFHKTQVAPSSAFKFITNNIFSYNSTNDLLKKIEETLKNFNYNSI